MKRPELFSRAAAALLAAVLLLALCPAAALAAEERTVYIGTPEALEALAARCASDRYSMGLTVRLTADIDLEGRGVSIPIFYGTFEGGGHRISGLRLADSAGSYGLFSRVEAGAVVRDVTVEGEIVPSGTQSEIGGVAGVNAGTLENCGFSGLVMGGSCVGGVAGRNAEGGLILNCRAAGVVRGGQLTGGVAGRSDGTLLRCTSTAAVNTTVTEEDLTAVDLESTMYGFLKGEPVSESAVTADTGGIVGYSAGAVQSCVNRGMVGYPHVGYNVGGVAGRQDGYMANCANYGSVQGRKDVGGIVGQMAPDVTLQMDAGSLDTLREELDVLQGMINGTLDDAQSASDSVSARVTRISDYADRARESANSLTGQLSSFVDENAATANALMLLVERYLAKGAPILDDLSAAAGSLTDAAGALRETLDALEALETYNDLALAQLQTVCLELERTCAELSDGLDALDEALKLVGNGPELPDTAQLQADLTELSKSAAELGRTVSRALEELDTSGVISSETREALSAQLKVTVDRCVAVLDDLTQILENTDFGALIDQELEHLRQIAQGLRTAAEHFSQAAEHGSAAMAALHGALGTLRTINGELDGVFDGADAALAALQQSGTAFSSACSAAARWAQELSEEEPGSFVGLGAEFDAGSQALNTSLSGMGNELNALNGELKDSSTALLSDLREINGQFMKIMDLLLDALDEVQNTDLTDIYEDVSEESLKSAVRGKVLECVNYGAVNADRNGGGVAGAMAIEYDLDREDDLLSSGVQTTRLTYRTRAVLLGCSSYGPVTTKKSCAGGVVGRMDLGTVYGCGGWGDVSGESGDYVGGVCGLSLSSIRSSYAKCTLSGRKYVGGIVGSGDRVSDCLSMVEIAACSQFGGAVAGDLTGEYTGNRFVSDTLAGVDRVSYSGRAEQVSYEALCAAENAPEEFSALTLTFRAEGETLKTLPFAYGASFTRQVFPEAPAREGCYIRWDRTDLTDLRFDTVVTAVYEPYVTALACAVQRSGRPVFLIRGEFTEEDVLGAEPAESGGESGTAESWLLSVPADGQTGHEVRWLLPEDGGTYTVYVNGAAVPAEVSGSYLCFTVEGSGLVVSFVPAEQTFPWLWLAVGGGAVLAGAAVLAVCLGRRKKRRGAKRAGVR